ncbi:hypothetical protein AB833_00910 [Chromatiales bacterium (ex Bugula neritina AB1)]|nr:hypothetical protein AB833_00910 [Chromatiales bacterium (ex Bugula neritina AB1)]
MADGTPGRTSPLAAAVGCGRTAMQASVNNLVELGLLERDTGYGHPLRSAYNLTPQGERVAFWASALLKMIKPAADRRLIRSKWSLPLICNLDTDARYKDLKQRLAPVTDRSLSLCLDQLAQRQWIARNVLPDNYPPAVRYRLDGQGHNVYRHLQGVIAD